ncbi:AAA family ATPase [Bordetella genomosp. 1]|uniref:AAA+ ATPase domain-containing protein n=1 Tax=Bordetella genomosp. 1 TaxID=1395607 RepID=A0ABX4EVT3_9BORD|nr:bifunctional aminoglycoside phosphotransferase/ATP-binding protein [Bordetella genomosp. 1]OZI58581.1 hypothetical protein CAL27_17990 [Bordetella genomosp. 1]
MNSPASSDDAQCPEALAFLTDPATHGLDAEAIRIVRTHISVVVLAGAAAYKLKRPVRLPYLDFSTLALRRAACDTELALNRRTAPALYRRVRTITRGPDGRLAFDGAGEPIEAVLEMARFDENTLFDRMAAAHRLTPDLMERLAGVIAAFHAEAAPAAPADAVSDLRRVLDANARAFAHAPSVAPEAAAALDLQLRQCLDRLAPRVLARARAGQVRRCHGDLHLRNICLVDGEPTLFDCLEFDEALATIDVLYDLAFVLMDLQARGEPTLANFLYNRYLDAAPQRDGVALLPFFMALRAQVRAHVAAQQSTRDGDAAADEARAYLALARRLLAPRPARLVAVGGPSGSGKSTVAAAIAHAIGPAPGARVISSDRVRKRLHGVSALTRLPPQAYEAAVSQRVYAAALEEAAAMLAQGGAVVADAVFDRADSRAALVRCARNAGVPFDGVWLSAPRTELERRVAARRNDPSDATLAVLDRQLAGIDAPDDWHVIAPRTAKAERPPGLETTVAEVHRRLGDAAPVRD